MALRNVVPWVGHPDPEPQRFSRNQAGHPRRERRYMNKTELVSTVAERTGVSQKDAAAVLDEFAAVAGEVVAKGSEKLTIPGFLSFEQTARKARTGRNPQTGEPIQIAASKSVKVSAGSRLKDAAKG